MNDTIPRNPVADVSRTVDLEKTEVTDCALAVTDVSAVDWRLRVASARMAERRAAVRYPCECQAFYYPTPALRHLIGGWLHVRNLSISGIGLIHRKPVAPGTILKLELLSKDQSFCRKVNAQVVRASPLPHGGWVLGCAFLDHLTPEEFRELLG